MSRVGRKDDVLTELAEEARKELGSTSVDEILGSDPKYPEYKGIDLKPKNDDMVAILGELLEKSPAFADYAKKRALAGRPMVRRQPVTRARDYQMSFPPHYGKKDEVVTLNIQPSVLFRGEKIIAVDSHSPTGTGTRILNLLIGQKNQFRSGMAQLTQFFGANALGSGIKMDTCQPALSIAATVSFIVACTFSMTIFGKAVV